MERQGDPRAEHRVQREERQFHPAVIPATSWLGRIEAFSKSRGRAARRARPRRPGNRNSRRTRRRLSEDGRRVEAPTSVGQWEQPLGEPVSSAVRKLEPQPQAATAFGLLTVKPAPIRVST